MKIAIIGGAGVRVPLLAGGLSRSDLRISEIALYDLDRARLVIIADLAQRMAGGVRVTCAATADAAIEGADFVITSIRVGGAAQRALGERSPCWLSRRRCRRPTTSPLASPTSPRG